MYYTIFFISDASVISEPVYTEIGNDEGTISSPNYPDYYPAFSNYTWKLNVTEGKVWVWIGLGKPTISRLSYCSPFQLDHISGQFDLK